MVKYEQRKDRLYSGEYKLLLELRVRDLGIIEKIDWRLGKGLNVITGETGAGKSLVIDAVEALLGGKVDEDAIRHGTQVASIEGIFSLPESSISALDNVLKQKGIKSEDETIIIHCELRRQGRSIVRINDNAVSKGTINDISPYLIDVHGQSEHLSLLNKKYHLDFLDSYAHTVEHRNDFSLKANELDNAKQELKSLNEQEKDFARREEFLRFQIDEIKQAKPSDKEDEELERERNILSSCEQLKALSYEAYQALYGEDSTDATASVSGKLSEAIKAIKKLIDADPALNKQLNFLEETFYGVEEAARDIRSYSEQMEHNPQRLEEIESRLELIRSLKRKYGQTINEILEYQIQSEEQLESLSYSSQKKLELEETCRRLEHEMGEIASGLSKARTKAARKLEKEVKQELQDLNMSQVEFEVSITRVESQEGIPLPDGKTYTYTNEGVDTVEFMASTNPGEPLKPLARIASTGEISRFMLALKGALSHIDNTPVLVFDEIDIGVGGRSGEIIGKKLWVLAQNRQVICVTHLPQIAAFADAHYTIHKEMVGERTISTLETLNKEAAVTEIAIMLSGAQYTDTSINNASELVQKARTWKKKQNSKN